MHSWGKQEQLSVFQPPLTKDLRLSLNTTMNATLEIQRENSMYQSLLPQTNVPLTRTNILWTVM
jgi:hypothetical protein